MSFHVNRYARSYIGFQGFHEVTGHTYIGFQGFREVTGYGRSLAGRPGPNGPHFRTWTRTLRDV